jgi:hypothetical protein
MTTSAEPSEPSRCLLIGLETSRLLPTATLFADADFIPALAFTSDQVIEFASVADIVIADDTIDPGALALQKLAEFPVGRVFIGDTVPLEGIETIPSVKASPAMIVARTLLRFTAHAESAFDDSLCWGPLELRPRQRSATWHDRSVHFTATEFNILVALVRAQGSVVTRDALQREVWPDAEPDDGERLNAHIRRIRNHIEWDSAHPRFVLTTRGIGFRLADAS